MKNFKRVININTVINDIDNYINDYFINNNIDINDYKIRTTLKHNTINHLLTCLYNDLFSDKLYKPYMHNSIIDYNDIELLDLLANKFISICQYFNKSLGLYSFSCFVGADLAEIMRWIDENGEKLNPERAQIIRKIQEKHKGQHIALLNDSSIGLLAVANNDVETGLNWQEKQNTVTQQNTVFLLPSERLERLRIEQSKPQEVIKNN